MLNDFYLPNSRCGTGEVPFCSLPKMQPFFITRHYLPTPSKSFNSNTHKAMKTFILLLMISLASCETKEDSQPDKNLSTVYIEDSTVKVFNQGATGYDTLYRTKTLDTTYSHEDFHVAVEANPAHNGVVNKSWMNNYVVTITRDNWRNKEVVKSRITYAGYDNNGVEYLTGFYEIKTFQHKADAVSFAKRFKSYSQFERYEIQESETNDFMNKKYAKENAKLDFSRPAHKDELIKPTIVY